jgi:hypothetical protein
VQDHRLLLATDCILALSKIPRLCNIASHELARLGMQDQRTQVWLGSVPDVRDRVVRDCNDSIILGLSN